MPPLPPPYNANKSDAWGRGVAGAVLGSKCFNLKEFYFKKPTTRELAEFDGKRRTVCVLIYRPARA